MHNSFEMHANKCGTFYGCTE